MKTKEKRFTEVCILDTCLSDYFQGYFMPVIAIPMYKKMTKKELAEDIQMEINDNWDYLVNENGFTEAEIKIFDKFCRKLKSEKNEIIYIPEISETDETEDFFEYPYMYLSLCKPCVKYGINFLNS